MKEGGGERASETSVLCKSHSYSQFQVASFLINMAFHINQTEYSEIKTKQISVRVSNFSYRTLKLS